MFSNTQSLLICGVIAIVFFIGGLLNILDHIITKLVLGGLVILVILNLFLVKKNVDEEDLKDSQEDSLK
ncbi:hypothetical protein [Lacinutrix sp. 5H-3-7-4]|uniref:hypothetical protein n=1 Tax=Lacinutrix sp. (strain 5H-3-7-4) TaxID=983544 RepID=UPI00020A3E54|nr:hypothetical protein [Lacinutrix sp. 5H-3-7-4]AEH01867.1 hypothetical protein Lacal_2021 [Lacinutrix sp. 5H-3-7-4]